MPLSDTVFASVKKPTPENCVNCAAYPFAFYGHFPKSLATAVQHLRKRSQLVEMRKTIYREGRKTQEIFMIKEGWAMRYKTLPDGRRQILSFLLPGDYISPQLFYADSLDFSVKAITDVLLCTFDRPTLSNLVKSDPQLCAAIGAQCAQQHRVCDRCLTDLGRRNAVERICCLILDLYYKQEERGMLRGSQMPFPLRRQHIADALGLTPIHVGRVFKQLTSQGDLEQDGRSLTLVDLQTLHRLSETKRNDFLISPQAVA